MTRTNAYSGYCGTSAAWAEASFSCASKLHGSMGIAAAMSIFVMAMLLALRLRGLVLAALVIIISMIIVIVANEHLSERKPNAAA